MRQIPPHSNEFSLGHRIYVDAEVANLDPHHLLLVVFVDFGLHSVGLVHNRVGKLPYEVLRRLYDSGGLPFTAAFDRFFGVGGLARHLGNVSV